MALPLLMAFAVAADLPDPAGDPLAAAAHLAARLPEADARARELGAVAVTMWRAGREGDAEAVLTVALGAVDEVESPLGRAWVLGGHLNDGGLAGMAHAAGWEAASGSLLHEALAAGGGHWEGREGQRVLIGIAKTLLGQVRLEEAERVARMLAPGPDRRWLLTGLARGWSGAGQPERVAPLVTEFLEEETERLEDRHGFGAMARVDALFEYGALLAEAGEDQAAHDVVAQAERELAAAEEGGDRHVALWRWGAWARLARAWEAVGEAARAEEVSTELRAALRQRLESAERARPGRPSVPPAELARFLVPEDRLFRGEHPTFAIPRDQEAVAVLLVAAEEVAEAIPVNLAMPHGPERIGLPRPGAEDLLAHRARFRWQSDWAWEAIAAGWARAGFAEEAFATLDRLRDDQVVVMVRVRIGHGLAAAGDPDGAQRALEGLEEEAHEGLSWALAEVAARLAEAGRTEEALAAAAGVPDPERRAAALAMALDRLPPGLDPEEGADLARVAVAALSDLAANDSRPARAEAHAWARCAALLTAAGDPAGAGEALRGALASGRVVARGERPRGPMANVDGVAHSPWTVADVAVGWARLGEFTTALDLVAALPPGAPPWMPAVAGNWRLDALREVGLELALQDAALDATAEAALAEILAPSP